MKIIAIDVETTGLDVNHDKILQIGAVMFDSNDMTTPVDELPHFETLVWWERYEGNAFALQMNQAILLQLATEGGPRAAVALMNLGGFIRDHADRRDTPHAIQQTVPPHPLGFNVAAMDLAMLKAHGMDDKLIHYRAFELGTMFAHPDTGPAGSSKIIPKLLGREVAHTALQDARDAVELYRLWRAFAISPDAIEDLVQGRR
jgi:oligoribonuclease (3'-5' exoribonuclease)